jgi:protein deglycase
MQTIFVHLADGFEEIEALTVVDVLRRANLPVVTVSIGSTLQVTGAHKISVVADHLFKEVDYSLGSMIILPGGMPGAKNLNEHTGLKSMIMEYSANGKYIAAICAAPLVLGGLGLLKGKNAVCYPGFESTLEGAHVTMDPCIIDHQIITARGVGAALTFALELVRLLIGEEPAGKLKMDMLIE